MLVRTLLAALIAKGYRYNYSGPEDVNAVFITEYGANAAPVSSMIYWAENMPQNVGGNVCILCAKREVFTAAQSIIIDYANRRASLDELRSAVQSDNSVSFEADACRAIMNNPVIFLNSDYAPVLWRGFESREEFAWLLAIDRAQLTNSLNRMSVLLLGPDENIPCRFLMSQYSYGENRTGFIIVVEKENEFQKVLDMEFVREICTVFNTTKRPDKGKGRRPGARERLITGLFYGAPKHPDMIKKQLLDTGWREREKYYVVAIRRSNETFSTRELKKLETMLKSDIYFYENYYVAIIGSSWREEIGVADLKELAIYLKKKKMIAGLSYGFFDITELSDALRQAIYAAQTIIRLGLDATIYAFADDIITYLADFCITHNGLSREKLCYPTVLKIKEYDSKYNTDYLNFLGVYIFANLSVKRTAEIMHYHRNTVYQKIQKLEDFFGLDFSDVYLYIKLYLSVTILNKVDEVHPRNYMLWKNEDKRDELTDDIDRAKKGDVREWTH